MQLTRRRLRLALLATAVAAVAVALGPLEAAADRSLPTHMVQHLLLLAVAAPAAVVALARPPGPGTLVAAVRGRAWGWWLAAATAVHVAAVASWHLPAAYELALRVPLAHAAEHATFLAASAGLWLAALHLRRGPAGAGGVIALFVAALANTALGAAMALAPVPWYPSYGSGAEARAGQQMAGAVMWGVGGALAAVAALALFATWLHRAERLGERLGVAAE